MGGGLKMTSGQTWTWVFMDLFEVLLLEALLHHKLMVVAATVKPCCVNTSVNKTSDEGSKMVVNGANFYFTGSDHVMPEVFSGKDSLLYT